MHLNKILFVINNMEFGGTRTSLLNLLSNFSDTGISIDLLILSPFGPLMNEIPSSVNIIKTPLLIKCGFTNIKYLNPIEIIIKIFLKALMTILGYDRLYSCLFKHYSKSIGYYDSVIGYQEGESNDCAAYLKCGYHCGWIHNDYENFKGNSKGIVEAYNRLDSIIFVAKSSLDSFVNKYPTLSGKCRIIKNTIDVNRIKTLSKESDGYRFDNNRLTLVSVGRVSSQKRFDRIIKVAKELTKDLDFKWIVIGDGESKNELIYRVNNENLEDVVTFIGAKRNPYYYMANADLLVVTSDYEAQPMVILESLTIGTPVVSTNFTSATELCEIAGNSLKLTKMDCDSIANTISSIFNNKTIKDMKAAATEFNYDNDAIVSELINIIGK